MERCLVPTSRRRPRASLRGVTLLEMMIVIAIVGVIAAIAVPNLSPLIQRQKLSGAAEELANLIEHGRRAAYGDGRCTRITLSGGALFLHAKTGSDGANCFDSAAVSGGTWDRQLAVVRPEKGISFGLASTEGSAILFRPNGRLRGNGDLSITNDGAQLRAEHAGLSEGVAVKVTPLGRSCKQDYAVGSPPAVAAESCS